MTGKFEPGAVRGPLRERADRADPLQAEGHAGQAAAGAAPDQRHQPDGCAAPQRREARKGANAAPAEAEQRRPRSRSGQEAAPTRRRAEGARRAPSKARPDSARAACHADASSSLRDYHQKRNFTRTAEPRGKLKRSTRRSVRRAQARRAPAALRPAPGARRRAEELGRHAGAPACRPTDKRLAVRTEDHPLDYAEFEGRIPEGEYGAGSVIVWDRGRWSTEGDPHEQLAKGHLVRSRRQQAQGPLAPRAHEGPRPARQGELAADQGRGRIRRRTAAATTCWRPSRARSRPAAPSRMSQGKVKIWRKDQAAPRARAPTRGERSQAAQAAPAARATAQSAPTNRRPRARGIRAAQPSKAPSPAALPGFVEPQLATLAATPADRRQLGARDQVRRLPPARAHRPRPGEAQDPQRPRLDHASSPP